MRLLQGEFDRETVYSDDPVTVARSHSLAGARRLHVVDLDAARGGSDNRAGVEGIVAGTSLEVQVAGGVRSLESARAWIGAGAAAVVMGTAAVRDPGLLLACAEELPVLAALDVKAGAPAVTGWTAAESVSLEDLIDRWRPAPLRGVILTAVDRDGTLAGPDLDLLARVRALAPWPLTYSGGIGDLADIAALARAGADSVIVGKALYENRFSLGDALAAAG